MNVAFRSLNINPDLFSIVGWVFLLLITANLISTVLEEPVVTACDTTNIESVTAAAEAAEKSLGPCSILVNTAAILRAGGLDTLSLAEWNTTLAVNLTGYFLCAQVFGRQMRKAGRGSLIHVASVAASNAQGFSGAYSVSKAGVVMLSRQLASEWGPPGRQPALDCDGALLRDHPRHQGARARVSRRREGADEDRDPRRQPGVLHGVGDALLREGRRPRRRRAARDGQGPDRQAGHRLHHRRVLAHDARLARGGRGAREGRDLSPIGISPYGRNPSIKRVLK
ncbi:SDR family oxidoreductase [Salmonella enterica subsp. enterica serovar Dessau]|uniref:SDR family oxidoreductase n=1 Tax=Salmonella enterica subsp. enterica serovar Dessau TaxID=2564349 RepID=A0A8E5MYE7_SALET|nr:SDR family oxidoreductase [Salmonella enterica subsp. enterica serovar Dessau]